MLLDTQKKLSLGEQAEALQAMTIEELQSLDWKPVQLNWTAEDLREMEEAQAREDAEEAAQEPEWVSIVQNMTVAELRQHFNLDFNIKHLSIAQKIERTQLSQGVIETIENNIALATFGDILRYCKGLNLPTHRFLAAHAQ